MFVIKGLNLKAPVKKHIFIPALLLFIFVLCYPMLISIYVLMPLFIGTMGYVLLEGLYKEKYFAVVVALIYLLNLETNLSLPLFFIVITSLVYYVVFYPHLNEMERCRYCKAVFSVLIINLLYIFTLYVYDFIFSSKSIVFDSMLWYALCADMLLVMVL